MIANSIPRGFKRAVGPLVGKLKTLALTGELARGGEYLRLRDIFIQNGSRSLIGSAVRTKIVEGFEAIDEQVDVASTPVEGLMLAEFALSLDCPGALVECGCYKGGSSAKLSIVAEATGRRLLVFDSFEGLPESDERDRHDLHLRRPSTWVTEWKAGRYASRMDLVRENIRTLGCLRVSALIKGWFANTLNAENLPDRIAMCFVDVDLASSARQCLVALWPRLQERGLFVSHDAAYVKVMQSLYDRELWTDILKSHPPLFFGAGFGLGDLAPHLGFAIKGENISAEYVKNLTLEK